MYVKFNTIVRGHFAINLSRLPQRGEVDLKSQESETNAENS